MLNSTCLKKIFYPVGLVCCAICLLQFCSNARSEFTEEEINKRSYTDALPEVKTQLLESTIFYKEFVSNGILQAQNKADLHFKVKSLINDITAKNGVYVKKGQVLAVLDDYEIQTQLRRTYIDYDNSLVELRSEIVSYGSELKDTIHVDKPRLKYFKIKSGYEKARLAMEEAKYKLKQTKLTSPINGVVANLKVKTNNISDPGEIFCTILDNRVFEVVFPVLEGEIDLLSIGQQIQVFPYSQVDTLKYEGRVSEINPMVDKHGMIEVKATVNNSSGKLLDGMNVQIVVKKAFSNQLVIPKEALLMRDGRKVVFTYQPKDSTSYWNYVDIGLENTANYTVTKGLKPSDRIIVKGNLNLAHESKVKIAE